MLIRTALFTQKEGAGAQSLFVVNHKIWQRTVAGAIPEAGILESCCVRVKMLILSQLAQGNRVS